MSTLPWDRPDADPLSDLLAIKRQWEQAGYRPHHRQLKTGTALLAAMRAEFTAAAPAWPALPPGLAGIDLIEDPGLPLWHWQLWSDGELDSEGDIA